MQKMNIESAKDYLLIYLKFTVNGVSVTDPNETNRETIKTIKKTNSMSNRESSSSEKYVGDSFTIILFIFVLRAKFIPILLHMYTR